MRSQRSRGERALSLSLPPSWKGWRRLGLMLSLLSLLGQFGAHLHLAVTRHVTCAEHGEAVELGPSQPGGKTSQLAPAGAHQDSLKRLPEGDVAHGHEHCLLASYCRERAATRSQSPSLEPLRAAPGSSLASGQVIVPVVIEILALAPKNSPPQG
jgi:hypothetical protein